jgi:hypothetical protein
VGDLSDRAVVGAWFELQRQGGCGRGEVRLRDEFAGREAVDVGDWIAFEASIGDRWYLGRVADREASSPAGVTLHLEGMAAQLDEVFPGGFGSDVGDGIPPWVYGDGDLFPLDPDDADQAVSAANTPTDVVRLLMTQFITAATDITYDPDRVVEPAGSAAVLSLKFRGEETARSVLNDLAVRARGACWGVDETGTFFFHAPPGATVATWREGTDLFRLRESLSRDRLYNRVVLTGGYAYLQDESGGPQVAYRWRGNYVEPISRAAYGERRIRLWVPWIRTPQDSQAFTREFFRLYAQPSRRYFIEAAATAVRPWLGAVRLEDIEGNLLAETPVETVRVEFDRSPWLRIEVGPPDPHRFWPEPPHDERWELPIQPVSGFGGGSVDLDPSSSSSSSSSGWPLLLLDTFTDADGTALADHMPEVGGPWTDWDATFTIRSNGIEPDDFRGFLSADVGTPDVRITAELFLGSASTENACGILLRMTDDFNYWLVRLDPLNDGLVINEVLVGARLERAAATMTLNPGDAVTLEVVVSGTTISATAEKSGSSPVSTSYSSMPTSAVTVHGLWTVYDSLAEAVQNRCERIEIASA